MRACNVPAVAISAFALIGADAPSSPPSPLRPFTDAAVTCAEATQGTEIATAVIERHGWTRRTEVPGAPAGAAQFWRPDVRFGIFDNPPLCTADWDVTSSSGRDTIFAAADEQVSQALAQAFPGRFQSLEYSTQGTKKIHRLAVGNAVVLLGAEPVGQVGNSVVLKLGAVNRENMPPGSGSGSPPSSTKGK